MKKIAFTLAEMLITLTIVGIVAAITIPTIISSSQNQKNAAALSVAVSDWESAMAAMMSKDGATDILETSVWKEMPDKLDNSSSDADIQKFVAGISEYLTIVDYYKDYETLYGSSSLPKEINGTDAPSLQPDGVLLVSKKGFVYCIEVLDSKNGYKTGIHLIKDEEGRPFDSEHVENTEASVLEAGGRLYNMAATVTIDTNGINKPNMWGRDSFPFYLGSDGILYPEGGFDASVFFRGDDSITWKNNRCTDSKLLTGRECTARLIENGYKVDY